VSLTSVFFFAKEAAAERSFCCAIIRKRHTHGGEMLLLPFSLYYLCACNKIENDCCQRLFVYISTAITARVVHIGSPN